MRILRVGDPHTKLSNLKDSWALIEFICKIAWEYRVDKIELLGDLFHNHAVIRVEVLDFWRKAFEKLSSRTMTPVICLVGNHDQPGSKEKEQVMNALSVFKDSELDVIIVDEPWCEMGIAYIPYMSDHDAFLKAASRFKEEKTLVAHQTFTGATYENGFYAEDGIDPALVPQDAIISGHIHKSQQVGKCFYPGTPKWDTASDANQEKGVWIFEHADDGSIISKKFISTEDVVTPIKKYIVNEGEEVPELNPKAKNFIEFHGKSTWISKMKKKYKGVAGIKGKPTDRKISKLDPEKTQTLVDYLQNCFEPVEGIEKSQINEYLKGVAA